MSKIAAVAIVTASAAISRWRTNQYVTDQASAAAANIDMSISNTAFPSSASTGENVVFMYFYQNETKQPTTDITVTTTIPDGMSFSSTNNQNYTMNGDDITWTDLADGYGLVLLELTVDNDAVGLITNTVQVSSSANDDYENNNTYPAVIYIEGTTSNTNNGEADASIEKQTESETTSIGQTIQYTIIVANDSNSPDDAEDVTVVDTLPEGVVFVTNSDTPDIDYQSGNTLARDIGTLAPGESQELEFSVLVSTLLGSGEALMNFATVSTTSQDDNINNNLDFVVTQVDDTQEADVGILSMAFNNASVATNTAASLNMEIENAGPSTAENTVLELTIPSGVSVQSISPTPSTNTTTKITRELGDIGTIYFPVSITFKGTSVGSKQFAASIGSDTPDFHEDDNTDTASIAITDGSSGGGSNNGGGSNGGGSSNNNGSNNSTHNAPTVSPTNNNEDQENTSGLTAEDQDLLDLFAQTFDNIAKSFAARECVDDANILYKYAKEHELTSAKNSTDFRLCDPITRIELAKIITQYSINIAMLTPDETRICNYTDMASASIEERSFARISCELGLMGLEYEGSPAKIFDPQAHVSRAMMSTIFSRLLFGDAYNGNAKNWYIDHMNALKKSGILKMIGDPMDDLLRGYAVLMLMRADINGVVKSSVELRNDVIQN